ncbi:MAG: hypothetical protein QF777_06215 [Acidimicrobiales bacterium]|nr:hypothetical protein [Acidimicrobiales bacterium]
MGYEQIDPGFPDPDDIDWDAEFRDLPQQQILIEYAHRRVMRLVDQWSAGRAGTAWGFEDLRAEQPPPPDARIGMIVVDQFAEAICEVFGADYAEIDADRGQKLIREILGCITQGVSIGLGATPDDAIDQNDDTRDSDEIGESR